MRYLMVAAVVTVCVATANAEHVDVAPPPRPVVLATIESSLPTAGGQIRQFAFDADSATHFASERNPMKDDSVTIRFDEPVEFTAARWITGRSEATDLPAKSWVTEVSHDGKTFEPFVSAKPGDALKKPSIRAVRLRVTQDMKQPLVVREIALDTTPRVVPFRYPVEIALDVTDAPEMKEWGDNVVRICERQYPKICDELMSEGYRPMTQIRMTLKKDYGGVAAAGGGRITGSVKYFKARPDDIGAMVHETVHCVQNYRGRNLPSWLVEGIADYIRFWRYEPGKAGRLQPERARYDASYRTTAAFLAYVSDKYDPALVTKLNTMLRQGKYDPGIWKTLTGKSVEELNQEWRQSLVR